MVEQWSLLPWSKLKLNLVIYLHPDGTRFSCSGPIRYANPLFAFFMNKSEPMASLIDISRDSLTSTYTKSFMPNFQLTRLTSNIHGVRLKISQPTTVLS